MSEDMPITSQPTTPEQPDGTVPRVEGVPEEVMPAETPLSGDGVEERGFSAGQMDEAGFGGEN